MKRSRPSRRPLFLLAAALAWPATSTAQFREPPAPAAYALTGVTVVGADGSRMDSVTLVVRDGLIEVLGRMVDPPADARVLEGDSLYVYPGFVDAVGKAEYQFPEREIDRAQVASWNPSRDVQSFMPHRRVVDYLTATGSDLAAQRKKGIVAAAVHPDGRLMPGRGALLMFRKNAAGSSDLVIQPVLGPFASLSGAQGVYPTTLFGVLAFYRQSFLDARHHAAHEQAFERAGNGVSPPAWDADLEVLLQVVNGDAPVFFAADLGRDIQRILALSEEFGFRPIIVGGEEAWKVADELKAADVPVLVSLDFPERERWKSDDKEKSQKEGETGEPGNGEDEGTAQAAESEELDAATLREKKRIEDAYSNAGRLEAAGVRFALTSGGGEADLLEGSRRAVEYGLSETAALRALTASPAELLGIGHVTRIGVGRPATFIVTDGPLFAEKTGVRYTFVEGALEEAGAAGAGGEAPTVTVTGEWSVTVDAGGQDIALTMVLSQEGATVTGSVQSPFGEGNITEGSVSGNSLSLTMVVGGMDVTMSGTVEGEGMSGTGDSPQGEFSWKAKRTGGPEGGPERRADR